MKEAQGRTETHPAREFAQLRDTISLLAHLRSDRRRLAAGLEVLHQISLYGIHERHSSDSLAQSFIEVLEQRLGYEYGAVLVVEPSSGGMIPYALSRQGKDKAFVDQDKRYVRSHALRVGSGITGWVAQTGRSVSLSDVRKDPRYYGMREDIRSELCVPVLVDDETVGVLNVETTKAKAYRPVDQHVLETVAAELAVVLAHTRLRERMVTICASCKKVRDEQQQWRPVEDYVRDHPGYMTFSHGVCPDCMRVLYPGLEE